MASLGHRIGGVKGFRCRVGLRTEGLGLRGLGVRGFLAYVGFRGLSFLGYPLCCGK